MDGEHCRLRKGQVGGGEVSLKTLLFPPNWRIPAEVHCWPESPPGGAECSLPSLCCRPGLLHMVEGHPTPGHAPDSRPRPRLPAMPPTPGHALPRLCLERHSSCYLWTLVRCSWLSHRSSIVSSPRFPTMPQLPCPALLLPIAHA